MIIHFGYAWMQYAAVIGSRERRNCLWTLVTTLVNNKPITPPKPFCHILYYWRVREFKEGKNFEPIASTENLSRSDFIGNKDKRTCISQRLPKNRTEWLHRDIGYRMEFDLHDSRNWEVHCLQSVHLRTRAHVLQVRLIIKISDTSEAIVWHTVPNQSLGNGAAGWGWGYNSTVILGIWIFQSYSRIRENGWTSSPKSSCLDSISTPQRIGWFPPTLVKAD